MTAVAPRTQFQHAAPPQLVDPLLAFVARAEARAILFEASEFDLHEAVDVLQHDAERDGLVDRIGQDALQEILAYIFEAVRA
jgi:hypothetical protein